MTKTVFNFSAGPAMMPMEVMHQVRDEFLNWHDTGISIAEISHRSQTFMDLLKQIKKEALRDDMLLLEKIRRSEEQIKEGKIAKANTSMSGGEIDDLLMS